MGDPASLQSLLPENKASFSSSASESHYSGIEPGWVLSGSLSSPREGDAQWIWEVKPGSKSQDPGGDAEEETADVRTED